MAKVEPKKEGRRWFWTPEAVDSRNQDQLSASEANEYPHMQEESARQQELHGGKRSGVVWVVESTLRTEEMVLPFLGEA